MRPSRLLPAVLCACCSPAALAQCEGWVSSIFESPSLAGPSSSFAAISWWDPDGAGPAARELVYAGGFSSIGGDTSYARIARWSGLGWTSMGAAPNNGNVRAVTNWDPDGAGPDARSLWVGGEFTTLAGQSVSRIARWDGAAWHPVGAGFNGHVGRLLTWDPDGTGPAPEALIAGGGFQRSGSTVVNGAARLEGGQWMPLGDLAVGGLIVTTYAMATWDPDGPGPQPQVLVIGGQGFHYPDSITYLFDNIAAYDNGAGWAHMGTGLNGIVRTLAVFDFDGDGPEIPNLVAGGDFTATGDGATPLAHLARWDGIEWKPVGPGHPTQVFALFSWDPDGDGPLPPELLASVSSASDEPVLRWTGSAWVTFPVPAVGAGEFAVWEPDGGPRELLVSGRSDFSNPPQATWMRWSQTGVPWFAQHPAAVMLDAPGQDATFTAQPAPGYWRSVDYRWTRDGQPVTDGPGGASAGGGVVSGATGRWSPGPITLTISGAQRSDAGEYRCEISTGCGGHNSLPAVLAFACRADFTGDGLIDFSDYLEFLNRYDAGDLSVDFNADGLVDFSDYLEFLNLYEAGC